MRKKRRPAAYWREYRARRKAAGNPKPRGTDPRPGAALVQDGPGIVQWPPAAYFPSWVMQPSMSASSLAWYTIAASRSA
jgi:hypothetical protein